jgi:putative ubiquitin-RnfH superfamily antitoxin RatB of RatAB toxin-antitoxin module
MKKATAKTRARVPATGKARRASAGPLAAPRREVLLRLDHLRSATREIARSYLANLEHDIIEIRETVGSAKTPDGHKATLRAIDRMGEVLDDLMLKPHKGRRSDLKKVEKAIRTLQRVIAKQGTAGPGSRR